MPVQFQVFAYLNEIPELQFIPYSFQVKLFVSNSLILMILRRILAYIILPQKFLINIFNFKFILNNLINIRKYLSLKSTKYIDMSDNTKTTAKKPRKIKGKTVIDIQKCKGCELCTVACKEDAISLSKDINNLGYRYAVVIDDVCTGCLNCAIVCPDGVIKVYRTGGKKKEQIATISNVKESITVTIDNPAQDDLSKMDYL
jgi:2-oxoglutarate ferredoxin oxidoreductase subunit delta